MLPENKWVFTDKAEFWTQGLRKAGAQVPLRYLRIVKGEYVPYQSWIRDGFIKRIDGD